MRFFETRWVQPGVYAVGRNKKLCSETGTYEWALELCRFKNKRLYQKRGWAQYWNAFKKMIKFTGKCLRRINVAERLTTLIAR